MANSKLESLFDTRPWILVVERHATVVVCCVHAFCLGYPGVEISFFTVTRTHVIERTLLWSDQRNLCVLIVWRDPQRLGISIQHSKILFSPQANTATAFFSLIPTTTHHKQTMYKRCLSHLNKSSCARTTTAAHTNHGFLNKCSTMNTVAASSSSNNRHIHVTPVALGQEKFNAEELKCRVHSLVRAFRSHGHVSLTLTCTFAACSCLANCSVSSFLFLFVNIAR